MTTTAEDTNTVGTYDINISGGAPSNSSYDIRYLNGELRIVDEVEEAYSGDGNTGVDGESGDGGNTGSGKNTGAGGQSDKGQTIRSKTKPSVFVTVEEETTSKNPNSTPDENPSSDGQKSRLSSFIPYERGIIIIDNLLFLFITLLIIFTLFRRKKKDEEDAKNEKG
jgi:hypothetical protein